MGVFIKGATWVGIGFAASFFGLSVGHGIRIARAQHEAAAKAQWEEEQANMG